MKATKYGRRYQITYRCPPYPKLINEYFNSKEEADLRIAQIQLEKKRGTLTPPAHLLDPDRDRDCFRETMTVEQLMREFIALYGLNHWSEGTLSCNIHRIEDYIIPYIGAMPIKDLTTHRLEQFYHRLQSEQAVKMKGREAENRTISFSVIEKVHALIRSALNQAIRWDYYRGVNPALTVELPQHKTKKRDVWSDREARYALEICDDPVLKLCMYLALGCSMRIGEILGLTWDCVHIHDDTDQELQSHLIVEKELRRSSKQCVNDLKAHGRDDVFFVFPPLKKAESSTILVLKTPKTESSVRKIYIPGTVSLALLEEQMRQAELKSDLASEYQDYNLVVSQNNGRPFEERIIAEKLRNFIAANGLRPVVFHSLRHSSTSLKLKISGGNIKAVQGDTGHAQSDMVTDVYAHTMDYERQHLAQQVDSHFFTRGSDATAPAPEQSQSVKQVMTLLESNPDIADLLLQMAHALGKTSHEK